METKQMVSINIFKLCTPKAFLFYILEGNCWGWHDLTALIENVFGNIFLDKSEVTQLKWLN